MPRFGSFEIQRFKYEAYECAIQIYEFTYQQKQKQKSKAATCPAKVIVIALF